MAKSVIACLKNKQHGGKFTDFEKQAIAESAEDLSLSGYSGDQAAIKAVEDILSDLDGQKQSVLSQIDEQRKAHAALYQAEEKPEAARQTFNRGVRQIARRLKGQVGGFERKAEIEQREELRERLKEAARSARKAMTEGKHEGVAAERERMKELIARATERRKTSSAVQSLRKKIKKELKTAAVKKQSGKPVGKFTPEVQDALNSLIMASRLSREEAELRLAENLKNYEEGELPPQNILIENHLLEVVARLDAFTDAGKLKRVLDEIKALKDEGRMINELRKFNRQGKDAVNVDKTVEELGGLPEGLKTAGRKQFAPKTISQKASAFIRGLGKSIVGWDDILDMLSSKTKSKPGESFISKFNDLLQVKNREKKGLSIHLRKVHDIYKEAFGLKSERAIMNKMVKDSTEVIKFRFLPLVDQNGMEYEMDLEFTRSELRKRVMELLDPSLADTFKAMGYSEATIKRLYDQLTNEDKKFVQLQMQFYQDYYEGVNEVYKSMYGVNLPHNEFYSPITREGVAKPAEDSMGEFMREMSFRATVTSGSLKSRVENVHTISNQSDLGALQQHIVEMEHFKAWAEKIRELNAVWKNPQVRDAIYINHSDGILHVVDKFLERFASGGMKLGYQLKGLDAFRTKFTQAALAVQPDIFIKQLTSFAAYADAMPTHIFIKNVALFFKNPIKNARAIYTSIMMQERGKNMERDIKQAMQSTEFSAFTKKKSLINLLMMNVQLGDQGAIVVGGWAYYHHLRTDLKLSHEEAIAKFEKFTEQTQQSGDITEQSHFQMMGPLAKLFTMFRSSVNQYVRKEIGAVRNYVTGRQGPRLGKGAIKTAKTLFIYHVLLPMFFQLASDRFEWDTDEELRAILFGPLNGVFILGDMLDWLIRGGLGVQQYDMEIPVYSVVHDAKDALDLFWLLDLEAEEFYRAVKGLAGVVGARTGLPLKSALDISKGAADVINGEYELGLTEMMGYSPYKAEELTND